MKKLDVLRSQCLSFCFLLAMPTAAAGAVQFSETAHGWDVKHYDLHIRIDYPAKRISGKAGIAVENSSGRILDEIPMILYRLMKVESISGPDDVPVDYDQNVIAFEDYDRLQVNFIRAKLARPLAPGESTSISIEYGGYLFGCSEAYGYVRETIDPAFTMIRDDSDAYPDIGYPSRLANSRHHLQRYSYDARITVPDSLVVVNGGDLVERTVKDGEATYRYTSRSPSWRMDFAIADYHHIESGKNTVFCLPEDVGRAEVIIGTMEKTLELYSEWWGPLKSYDGLTVIEIPEGFGSQTDITTIIQRAEAFNDPKNLIELYHELSHKWNVKAIDAHPPRIEEGLATFLQSLTVEELEGRQHLDGYMDRLLDYLRRVYEDHPEYADIPIAKFGEKDMGEMSYTTAAVFYRLLYGLVGKDDFNGIIRSYYKDHFEPGGTIEDQMDYIRSGTDADVSELINDWIYSPKYAEYIISGVDIEEMRAIYR